MQPLDRHYQCWHNTAGKGYSWSGKENFDH